MKRKLTTQILWFGLCSAALPLLAAVPSDAKTAPWPEYSMVLVGGGLHTCSSLSQTSCSAASQFPASAKTAERYALSLERIRDIGAAAVWQPSRAEQRQKTLAILRRLLLDFGETPSTEAILLQRWRVSSVSEQGHSISGETLYQQLSETELNLIFDLLQQPATAAQQHRQREHASLAQTQDTFSREIYQKIVELAGKTRQKAGKPRMLLVTASGRDPLAAVDFYLSAFSEAGADVQWLPLNAAYQAAWQHKTAGEPGCARLPQLLADIHGSYQRDRVYPDLMQQLTEFCRQGPAAAVAQIQQADAIFFNGGDQSLTLRALQLADGSPGPELQAITARLRAGKLLIAGTSAGTAVQAGGQFAGKPVPMISNGSSRQALHTGAVASAAPLAGCEKNRSCPADMAEDQLTYRPQGGLGLFSLGVLDTHFSERGRESRLVRLLSDSQTRYGFGIDENTALLVGFDPTQAGTTRLGVLGAGGVYIADLADAKANGTGADWQISQVRTHYLSRDDQAMMHNGELSLQFAPWKKPVSVAPQAAAAPQADDFLAGDSYRRLALQLCRSGQAQAQGRSAVARLQMQQRHDSKAVSGIFAPATAAVNYCAYQNFYLQISR